MKTIFRQIRAKKNYLRMEIRLDRSDEVEAKLAKSDLDLMDYDRDVKNNEDMLKDLLNKSYEFFSHNP